ncbi:MAG TPA: KH domain-containing protein [Methanomassiliicoccales archaeon]|nr:KH domain-containing protein [Methanomassiliicoccales archaeon]
MKGVRIPKDRIGVLIGRDGETKRYIEERSKVKIQIDAEGEVLFDDSKIEDPLMQLKIMDVLKAIGRGFSPHHAYRLFDDDEYFELIEMDDYVGKKSEQLQRVRARLIGSGGKTRRIIEEMSGANLSIYGSTVAIIGNSVQMPVARTAVDMILSGSEHATVYRFLERSRGTLRIAEMGFDP